MIAAPGFPADITLKQYEAFMEHFIENGFTSMSVTISNGSDKTVQEVFERAEVFNEYLAIQPDRYMKIESLADFVSAKEQDALGVFFNLQSMNAFGEDIGNVEKNYDLGLRTANFTYNVDNAYGGGAICINFIGGNPKLFIAPDREAGDIPTMRLIIKDGKIYKNTLSTGLEWLCKAHNTFVKFHVKIRSCE